MARKRTANLKGNGKTEFTITQRQNVKIKYDLHRGRSASLTWIPFSGGKTTERHPTQVIIEGIDTGTVFERDSKGQHRNNGSTSQTLQPDTYILYGRGAGEGNDRKSKITASVEYTEGTTETDEGQKTSFADMEVANLEKYTPEPVKNLADQLGVPSIALMGGIGLLLYMLFIK